MNFRKLDFRRLGVVALVLLLAVGAGAVVKKTARQAESSISQTNANLSASNDSTSIVFPEDDFNNERVQPHHDATTLAEILEENDLLSLMADWQGKALFVTLDTTQSPHGFRYYYYNAFYQDSNHNAIQDSADQGFFNPASTVKVAIALLTLESLSEQDLTREAEYRKAGTRRWYSFEEDIRRALVISDNEATNRLILWLGFDQINNKLASKGFSHLAINRLMLDQGTLISSPAFEMRLNGEKTRQSTQPVTVMETCYETREKVGNCASAYDLLQGLIQLNHPEYFSPDQKFALSPADRAWVQTILSRTPQVEGFKYADDYCRFLTILETRLASATGKLLSKCGVALFTNTYTDLSYLETDIGRGYYILLSVSPPPRTDESKILDRMNQIAEAIVLSLP